MDVAFALARHSRESGNPVLRFWVRRKALPATSTDFRVRGNGKKLDLRKITFHFMK
jgi:hypothetical protein